MRPEEKLRNIPIEKLKNDIDKEAYNDILLYRLFSGNFKKF